MNCTSRVIATSSPTSTPPVSSAEFQESPKSFLLIFAVAESPIRVLPHGSLPGSLGPSTANVTDLVIPCKERSPGTAYSPKPVRFTLFDLNVIVGNFSTLKKSALFRCASRCASPVVKVATSIDASIVDWEMSAAFSLNAPVMPVKYPLTFEIIMCFTLNSTLECAGSSFQEMKESGATEVVAMLNGSFHFIRCAGIIFVATTNSLRLNNLLAADDLLPRFA